MHRYFAMIAALALFASASLTACSGAEKGESSYAAATGPQSMLDASRKAAENAIHEKDRSLKRDAALQGIDAAERCLMAEPENPGCYYWRAVNTGLYHSVHVTDYQKGIRRMIGDCEKSITINPNYENAGAYRMLGQLYTKLPQTAIHPDSVTRDLDRAEGYLRKAVMIAPQYPENHLALSETLVENGKTTEAKEELAKSRELAPQWRKDISYEDWQHEYLALERKISDAM